MAAIYKKYYQDPHSVFNCGSNFNEFAASLTNVGNNSEDPRNAVLNAISQCWESRGAHSERLFGSMNERHSVVKEVLDNLGGIFTGASAVPKPITVEFASNPMRFIVTFPNSVSVQGGRGAVSRRWVAEKNGIYSVAAGGATKRKRRLTRKRKSRKGKHTRKI
jgi:hypothetical protein